MKRVLVLVDFYTRDMSPPTSDETERAVARIRAATDIANRIRPYFSRVVALDASVGKFAGQGEESEGSAGDLCAEFVELLRKERVTDVYLLGATPSPSLVAAAIASRRSEVRTWAIADTWPPESVQGSAQERLRHQGVTLIRSAEVDAGCCV